MVRPRWEVSAAVLFFPRNTVVVDDSCVPREPAQIETWQAFSFSLAHVLSFSLYIRQSTLPCGLANKNKTQNARRRVERGR